MFKRKPIEMAIKILIFATFFVPLIVVPSSFIFPFIVPKILTFRSLTVVILALYGLLVMINPADYKPKFTILNVAVIGFLVSFLISTFVGVDPYHSFWDNHERMLGLFTVFHYIAYFFVCSSVFKTWSEWKKALRVFLVAGSVVMFFGFVQVINPNFLLNGGSARIISTLGNAIYVGGYGLFLFFISLLLILSELGEEDKKQKLNYTDGLWTLATIIFSFLVLKAGKAYFLKQIASDAGNTGKTESVLIVLAFLAVEATLVAFKKWRYLEISTAIFALIGLVYSGTRGSMLGLVVGVGIAAVSYIFTLRGHKKIRNSLIGLVAAGVILIVLAYLNRANPIVANIPTVGRVLNTPVSELTGGARVLAWKVALESWKEKPIFGWGPNNFFYAFNDHYDPRSLEYGYGETWFDNAHNIIVNTLAVQGLIGLVAYLFIFVAAWYMLVIAVKKKNLNLHIATIGGAFLLAHLVQNVTVFENPTSYLYFMVSLAMVNSLGKNDSEKPNHKDQKPADRSVSAGVVSAFFVVGFVVIFIFDIQPARANMKTLEALQVTNADPSYAIPIIEEALKFSSPHIDDIRDDISRAVIDNLSGAASKLPTAQKDQLFSIAESALQQNTELHPLDIRIFLSLSQLYQTKALQNNDVQAMLQAEMNSQHALELSPRRQQIMYNLAIIKAQLGKIDDAVGLFNQAINDDPKIGESYMRLAYLYSAIQRPADVRKTILLGQKNGAVYNDQQQQAMNQLLASASSTIKGKK